MKKLLTTLFILFIGTHNVYAWQIVQVDMTIPCDVSKCDHTELPAKTNCKEGNILKDGICCEGIKDGYNTNACIIQGTAYKCAKLLKANIAVAPEDSSDGQGSSNDQDEEKCQWFADRNYKEGDIVCKPGYYDAGDIPSYYDPHVKINCKQCDSIKYEDKKDEGTSRPGSTKQSDCYIEMRNETEQHVDENGNTYTLTANCKSS